MGTQPNILLVFSDDHAGWAMGCAGVRELQTPAMDHLARRGTRFSDAITPCPVCSPARASLWTGTLPSWHGVHDHLNGQGHPGIGEQPTLAQALQQAGYRCGQVGKWHCHSSEDNRPRAGFERWFSQAKGTSARFGPQVFWDQDRIMERHGHQAPILTEVALDFLRSPDPRPWLLCVGYTDTHSPFQDAPARHVERYAEAQFDAIPDETLPACHGRARMSLNKHEAMGRAAMREYYAAVSMIDEQLGRLLDELDSLGRREDTVVIYAGDHGHCTGHHGVACKGNGTIPQNFFDESLQVPLIVHVPGTPEGQICSSPVDHCDSFQALLELAGASAPDAAPRPGVSWLPAVHGHQLPARELVFAEYGNARMVRSQRLKLIRRGPGPNGRFSDECYDRQADPRETRNVIDDADFASAIAELDAALEEHFATYQHPERSGWDIQRQAPCNPAEPWRVTMPAGA